MIKNAKKRKVLNVNSNGNDLPIKKNSAFRLNAKNLFLTFPQCEVPKDIIMENIKKHFGANLDRCCVCQEEHMDGNLHLHVYIGLKKEINYKDPKCLDNLSGGKHGNYRACKSWRATLKYVAKKGNYISHNLDVEAIINDGRVTPKETGGIFNTVAVKIMNGVTKKDLVNEYPGFVLQHNKKISDFINMFRQIDAEDKLPYFGVKVPEDHRKPEWFIWKWISKNLLKARKFKKEQLWIWGETNLGKTSLLLELSKYFKVYWMGLFEEWEQGYTDEYDLIVMDEFKGQRPITWMNGLVQGAPFSMRTKGQDAYLKTKNLPVIVCSNYSISGCYNKIALEELKPIQGRFIEVELKELLDVKQFLNNPLEIPTPQLRRQNAMTGHEIEDMINAGRVGIGSPQDRRNISIDEINRNQIDLNLLMADPEEEKDMDALAGLDFLGLQPEPEWIAFSPIRKPKRRKRSIRKTSPEQDGSISSELLDGL